MILFLFFLVVALICLIAGYVFAKVEVMLMEQKRPISFHQQDPLYPPDTHSASAVIPKPKGEAYVIERPSAQQLSEWDEDPQTRLSKEGMKEALDKNPILRQAKEAAEAFMKGATQ